MWDWVLPSPLKHILASDSTIMWMPSFRQYIYLPELRNHKNI